MRPKATLFALSIHQISDAARVCDRFVLLSAGQVRGEGTLDELAAAAEARGTASRQGARRRCSLRSRRGPLVWLVHKEWRELLASRAWWALLLLTGPLVGLSFISAVGTYAEVSTGAGTGCGFVCNPLDGIWAPTFSAYEVAAVFLLPFVVIRLVSGDRQSGALAIELQRPLSPIVRMGAKALVLLAGWAVTCLAAMAALALWIAYGGTAYAPEIPAVVVSEATR